ncbi:hypothetical protein IEQ34_012990 [Dendrobium chrysotoxum]|uniref:Uncharacterized protein n=1 Tax=Dendrobium chrysotoxum TaxID=161865 RepID=A0AAV7GNB2_DENCH|nr:hypothetical protein IEQ34_012990 [Dendrobium chrysotoxum]
MADPEHDHGFVFDLQGRVDVHRSLFFDINFEIDHTVKDYIDRIFFSLTIAIDEHQLPVQWPILQHPPTISSPNNSSLSNIGGMAGVWNFPTTLRVVGAPDAEVRTLVVLRALAPSEGPQKVSGTLLTGTAIVIRVIADLQYIIAISPLIQMGGTEVI